MELYTDSIRIDEIIEKLLKTPTTQITKQLLSYEEIQFLINETRKMFLRQSTLLELRAPIKIVGDVHGQYRDLRHMFDMCGHPPDVNYLFLGDYVDRGKQSIETICLLFAYKLKYPNNFFLLRGNHEAEQVNKTYGFYDECKRRYDHSLWKMFGNNFDCLPIAAVIDSTILCMHGGLSPELTSLNDIKQIKRPTGIPDKGLLCDLMWSDPTKDHPGWVNSDRGISYIFGEEVLDDFLKQHKLELICRAHQCMDRGYSFFGKKKGLVTVFSAPNYCGESNNFAAVMSVNESLMVSFKLLRPSQDEE